MVVTCFRCIFSSFEEEEEEVTNQPESVVYFDLGIFVDSSHMLNSMLIPPVIFKPLYKCQNNSPAAYLFISDLPLCESLRRIKVIWWRTCRARLCCFVNWWVTGLIKQELCSRSCCHHTPLIYGNILSSFHKTITLSHTLTHTLWCIQNQKKKQHTLKSVWKDMKGTFLQV